MKEKTIKVVAIGTIAIASLGNATSVLAAGNCAYSAGKGYSGLDMSATTISVASYCGSMGYSSYYSTDSTTNSILRGYFQNGTRRLESDLIFLTGHGSQNDITTTGASGLKVGDGNSRCIGTNEINWNNNVKLVVLLACETAKEPEHIAVDIFRKSSGQSVVLGWREVIYDTSASSWANNFYKKLREGNTVGNAINYANSQTYQYPNIKNIGFFGDWDKVVSNNTRKISNISIESKNENIIYLNEEKIFNKESIKSTITELLKDVNSQFELKDYELNIYKLTNDKEYYTIDLVEKIGDFYTNSGYTIIVEDGVITQIANNKIDYDKKLKENLVQNLVTTEKVNEAKRIASNKITIENSLNNNRNITMDTNTIETLEIKEQKSRLYMDLQKNKKYIQVLTTYTISGREGKNGASYLYEI